MNNIDPDVAPDVMRVDDIELTVRPIAIDDVERVPQTAREPAYA